MSGIGISVNSASFAFIVMAFTSFVRAGFNLDVDFQSVAMVQLWMGLGVALFFMPVLTILLSDLEPHEIAAARRTGCGLHEAEGRNGHAEAKPRDPVVRGRGTSHHQGSERLAEEYLCFPAHVRLPFCREPPLAHRRQCSGGDVGVPDRKFTKIALTALGISSREDIDAGRAHDVPQLQPAARDVRQGVTDGAARRLSHVEFPGSAGGVAAG